MFYYAVMSTEERIQSIELATRLAYAEKPYRDVAATASNMGTLTLNNLITLELLKAEACTKETYAYVYELEGKLTSTEPEQIVANTQPGFILNGGELFSYAERIGASRRYMVQLLGALYRGISDEQLEGASIINDGNPYRTEGRESLTIVFETPVSELTDSLMDLRYLGKRGVSLLNSFVKYQEESSESDLA